MTAQKNGFVLYHNYFNQLALLSMEERGILITAIFEYTRDGQITVEMSPTVNMAFSFIKDTLDRDLAAYRARCEQNTENGKKGGRPRKSFLPSKTEGFSKKPKKADNDKENDKENEKEIEKEIDMERDKEMRLDPQDEAQTGYGRVTDENGSAVPYPAPLLSEKERENLRQKGIPEGYITARLERAVKHAHVRDRSVAELLLEWWQADRTHAPWKLGRSAHEGERESVPSSSFETDDFFQAALEHSMRVMERENACTTRK